MINYYPPWGFYYKVEFSISKLDNDVRFQSVSGLSVEYEAEEFKEGGENRFTHKLPVRTKYTDLVLKRGLLINSDIINWCTSALENMIFSPSDILITLLNEKGEALKIWNIVHAWPKKWTISDFNSSDNSVVIETLELSYRYFSILK